MMPVFSDRVLAGQRIVLAIACALLWAFEVRQHLTDDVAWLLDAGARWFGGQTLYADILEYNPPLVFYDMAVLTGGTWTKPAYLAGVCVVIFISAEWCGKTRWPAFIAMTLPALGPFGQRDHLALIAALPFVVATDRSRLTGLWAFFGTALKPYLLLIPALAAVWSRRWKDRACLTLACAVLTYGLFILFVHPLYVTDMIPSARTTYGSVGHQFTLGPPLIVILVIAALNLRNPATGALVGGLLSFLLQGKFFYYHFVPAMGLGFYLALTASRLRVSNFLLAALLAWFCGYAILEVTAHPDPIPPNAKRVLFLTAKPTDAYPLVTERGVEHVSPFASIGPVSGAVNNPASFNAIRRRQMDAIVQGCPEYIITNPTNSFDYLAFMARDPRFAAFGYRFLNETDGFRIFTSTRCLELTARVQGK